MPVIFAASYTNTGGKYEVWPLHQVTSSVGMRGDIEESGYYSIINNKDIVIAFFKNSEGDKYSIEKFDSSKLDKQIHVDEDLVTAARAMNKVVEEEFNKLCILSIRDNVGILLSDNKVFLNAFLKACPPQGNPSNLHSDDVKKGITWYKKPAGEYNTIESFNTLRGGYKKLTKRKPVSKRKYASKRKYKKRKYKKTKYKKY